MSEDNKQIKDSITLNKASAGKKKNSGAKAAKKTLVNNFIEDINQNLYPLQKKKEVFNKYFEGEAGVVEHEHSDDSQEVKQTRGKKYQQEMDAEDDYDYRDEFINDNPLSEEEEKRERSRSQSKTKTQRKPTPSKPKKKVKIDAKDWLESRISSVKKQQVVSDDDSMETSASILMSPEWEGQADLLRRANGENYALIRANKHVKHFSICDWCDAIAKQQDLSFGMLSDKWIWFSDLNLRQSLMQNIIIHQNKIPMLSVPSFNAIKIIRSYANSCYISYGYLTVRTSNSAQYKGSCAMNVQVVLLLKSVGTEIILQPSKNCEWAAQTCNVGSLDLGLQYLFSLIASAAS